MSVLLDGLVHVFGLAGSGKSSFALTASDEPGKVSFLDGDASKGRRMAEDLEIEHYYDLTHMAREENMNEIEYQEMVLGIIEDLPDGLDVIILDNATGFFKGAQSYVSVNRDRFRKKWSPSGKYATMQEWGVMRSQYLPAVYSEMLSKAELVMILTHVTDDYDDSGIKTGKKVAEADESLEKAAGIIIRLVRDTRTESSAPVVLLIKKPRPRFEPSERRVIDVFPERIAPCTWSTIEHYLENPIGLKDVLEDHEIPNDFEVALIEGSLNEEQRKEYEARREARLMQRYEDMREAVLEAADNISLPKKEMVPKAIVSRLMERFPNITPQKVKDILEEAE